MSRRQQATLPRKRVTPPTRLVVMNPSRGLNNLVSPSLIDNREFSDLMNMEYDEGGVVRKRYGYITAGNTLTAARGLGIYRTEILNQMVTVDNGTLKYRTTGNWTAATGATFTTATDTSFTQARLKLFVWNGTDGGAYFDGNAVTRPGTMPKAKFSVYYQSYHLSAGVAGQPNRLFASNVADATDFTVAAGGTQPQPDSTSDTENGNTNVPGATVYSGTPAVSEARVFDVRKNDGDKITGLAVFQDIVVIFKERSIYQFTFDANGLGSVTPITYATGAISHKSIVSVENDIYFMSREGLRVLGNQQGYISSSGSTIRTRVISVRIQPTIDSIAKAYYERVNACYAENKYILAVPTGSSSTIARTIAYDVRFEAFTVWSNFNAQAMVKYIDTNNDEQLYFLDDGGTQVYKRDAGTYSDNGSAIEAYVVSKAQDAGQPDLTKFWVDIRPIFRRLNGQVAFTIYQDDSISVGSANISSGASRGMGLNIMGTFGLGADGETTTATTSFVDNPESIVLNLNSRAIKFKIYNNRVNENFVLLGMVYAYYPKSHYFFDSSRKIYL